MSRDYKNSNNGGNTATQEKAPEREPYEIEIEPIDFKECATGYNNSFTSLEICNMANSIFKAAYEDYEGSKFYVDTYGRANIVLFFNHRPYAEDATIAFSQNIEEKNYANSTLARVKRQTRYYKEGNAYKITQDGKDVIDRFIYDNMRNKNGKITNWDAITTDVSQPNNQREQLSQVNFIDPVKIFKEIYGTKDPITGADYDYEFVVINSLAGSVVGAASPVYLTRLTQINKVQLDRALRNAGIVNPNGLGIIK